MDSLLKLTEDVIAAVDGIKGHSISVMGEILNNNDHPHTDTREPDESATGSSDEDLTDENPGTFSIL